MTSGHVFIATSLDGFIARPDGSIDWLPAPDDPAEDYGYGAFMQGIDGLIMGRGSYEAVRAFDSWPYQKPVLVLSKTLAATSVPKALQGKVRFADLTPAAAMAEVAGEGWRGAYVDGGQVVQSFLRAGLIADMVVTQIPILLGQGRPLFGPTGADIHLHLIHSRSFPNGLVQSHYRIIAGPEPAK